jgi:peptidyl-prolyl cis-trans isomerase C
MEVVRVNGIEVAAPAIAAELQYHPAPSREAAWEEAARALVVRRLLLDEAGRLGIAARATTDANAEEATIEALLAREVAVPEPDTETCRRYWMSNPGKFKAPDVYEAAHILFPAAPEDAAARATAKAGAAAAIAELQAAPQRFAELARARSACPSAANGGVLGQQSRGDLVPELETFILAMEEGQVCPVPVASRYGFHVLRLDRLVRGELIPFEQSRPEIERHLVDTAWRRGVSQYLHILAGRARIEGVAVPTAATPLVQ